MFIPPIMLFMLFMLFMLLILLFMLPIPEFIMPPAGDAIPPNDEGGWPKEGAVGTCLGVPPGGGGKLNPVGVLVPFAGGGAMEKEEL